jgi:hypothetical protein
MGVSDFLSIPLGTPFSFSYEFTILHSGQTGSNVQTETLTEPATTQTVRTGRANQLKTIQVPAETMTIAVNVPQGLEPLLLPDDFNQTINNQFCFIIQNSNGNYSLNTNALDAYEISNITQTAGSAIAFLNASANVKENAWYTVTASISDTGIKESLFNTNGSLIESTVTPYNSTNGNEVVMLIANNVDSAVIFKDLTVQTLISTTPPPKSIEKATDARELLLLYVTLSILLVVAFIAALVYYKKHKRATLNQSKV